MNNSAMVLPDWYDTACTIFGAGLIILCACLNVHVSISMSGENVVGLSMIGLALEVGKLLSFILLSYLLWSGVLKNYFFAKCQ